jgi:hypothetical protein
MWWIWSMSAASATEVSGVVVITALVIIVATVAPPLGCSAINHLLPPAA